MSADDPLRQLAAGRMHRRGIAQAILRGRSRLVTPSDGEGGPSDGR